MGLITTLTVVVKMTGSDVCPEKYKRVSVFVHIMIIIQVAWALVLSSSRAQVFSINLVSLPRPAVVIVNVVLKL